MSIVPTKSFDYSCDTGITTGIFAGDGSRLTGVDPFPYSGDAEITGSLSVTANTGNVEFSYEAVGAAAWSSGGSLITARRNLAGAGTQNAGLAFGGSLGGGYYVSCTEEYNGSTWSAGGDLITAREGLGGAGTQNAGLAFGGGAGTCSCTEEYDGTSWSSGGDLINGGNGWVGAGTQNAGLGFGVNGLSCTEEYDGTSWSAGGSLITARGSLAGTGTQNAGLAFGGSAGFSVFSCTEEYDGSSWATGGSLSVARYFLAGAGTQNAGLAFGGTAPPSLTCTEEYDGSSWSAGGSLITARGDLSGTGTQNAGLAFGGYISPDMLSCTEEYSPSSVITKTFDYSCDTGDLTVKCLIQTSAERYKANIQPLGSQISNVMKLQPVEFDWKSNNKHDIGFVAESVRDVYPTLVSLNKEGEVEGMSYSKLVSALVKSIQEQQEQINELVGEINKLKK